MSLDHKIFACSCFICYRYLLFDILIFDILIFDTDIILTIRKQHLPDNLQKYASAKSLFQQTLFWTYLKGILTKRILADWNPDENKRTETVDWSTNYKIFFIHNSLGCSSRTQIQGLQATIGVGKRSMHQIFDGVNEGSYSCHTINARK